MPIKGGQGGVTCACGSRTRVVELCHDKVALEVVGSLARVGLDAPVGPWGKRWLTRPDDV